MLPLKARVEKNNPLPRHFQVRQILMEMVQTEIWNPGDKIPAETDIAQALDVSKMTVNKAILALTAEGVFVREVGRGTFVARVPATSREEREAASGAEIVQVVIVAPPEYVSDNEYLCSLMLSMRCCVSPVEVTIRLRQVRGMEYAAKWRDGDSNGWILIAPMEEDVPGLHMLQEAGARAVVLGAEWNGVGLSCVDSDNIGGTTLAVEHLAEIGHRDIALLYGCPNAANTQDRVRGFRQAMAARGLETREEWMIDCETASISPAMRAHIAALLHRPDRPTAIFAAGPLLACALLEITREAGIEVPRDLSIVGFDDPTAVAMASPALTTVRQPLQEMGREAVAMLRRFLHHPAEEGPTRQILPCRLLIRDSTAIPPVR